MAEATVRLLLLGDSCVGKTTLAHLLANGSVLAHPSWTVGATAHVLLHEYNRQRITVEVLDVCGSRRYPEARAAFYADFDGIVLVHDVTNLPSFKNLRAWLQEALGTAFQWRTGARAGAGGGGGGLHARAPSSPARQAQAQHLLEAVAAEEAGGAAVPVFIVGTKLDASGGAYVRLPPLYCLDDAIQVSGHDANALLPHTREGALFRSFLDHVVVRQSSNSYGRHRRHGHGDVSDEV
mmetsp:Transcript_13623/g.53953  ORF Transcript_13623/g.53953 Transcript_13623/m.53953 type:complete len:237 (+) Transcript_13623:94-804(+)